ncbi:unnamed protein product [Phaedon cochleariae]|uniref:kynurenine--oxoglutarate transaminase n=1 Tax=Phaedon cochleariae TaxID=80249 RepID=A0A9N9X5E3_PHACE|nr:unnamed protein product [Phaedon cochleariae]
MKEAREKHLTAKIINHKLIINGTTYTADELEKGSEIPQLEASYKRGRETYSAPSTPPHSSLSLPHTTETVNIEEGHPRLVQALAKLYSNLTGQNINPYTEVIITTGAYEALFCAIMGHVDKDDEVILIEPFFDCLEPIVRYAGGKPRFLSLRMVRNNIVYTVEEILEQKEIEESDYILQTNSNSNTPSKSFNFPTKPTETSDITEAKNTGAIKKIDINKIEKKEEEKGERKEEKKEDKNKDKSTNLLSLQTIKDSYSVELNLLKRDIFDERPTSADWVIDKNELENAFNDKTKVIILNSPNNPLGKVFTQQEMTAIADLCKKWNVVCISDEVYEWLVYEPMKHIRMAPNVELHSEADENKDFRFTKWMTKNVGLQGIPCSVFFSSVNKTIGENYVRYCFTKRDDVLKKVQDILMDWKSRMVKY